VPFSWKVEDAEGSYLSFVWSKQCWPPQSMDGTKRSAALRSTIARKDCGGVPRARFVV
jgi:hypothetical protein